jgi:hypothetical protein
MDNNNQNNNQNNGNGSQQLFITQDMVLAGAIKQRHLAPSPVQVGDLYYGNGGNFLNLPIGTSNQFLTVVNGIPAWVTYVPPASTSLSSKTITFTRDTTASGADVAYTGVGFIPTCVILFSILGNVSWSTAVFDSAKTPQALFQIFGGVANQNPGLILESSANNYQQAILKTYDADGFTLTWSKTNSPTGTGNIVALCFK